MSTVWLPYRENAGPSGLRVRYDRGLHPFIRRELKIFCRWLRWYYHFPAPVQVYICHAEHIRARDGQPCSGTCFQENRPGAVICIHIAAGASADLTDQALKNRLWGCIFTLAHELTHYYQYLSDSYQTTRGMECQATRQANRLQALYYEDEWDSIDDGWPDALPPDFVPPAKERRPVGYVH